MNERFAQIINAFSEKNILVIGDVMLDKFIYGKVQRISPEAPIPIVKVERETNMPGGAGNTAVNISSLGALVNLIGVVGEDGEANMLKEALEERKVIPNLITNGRTTQKIRIIGEKQQIVRVDHEEVAYLEEQIEKKILDKIKELVNEVDVIIISDYGKGCITKNLAAEIISLSNSRNKRVVIGPKPQHKDYYKGAFLIIPNDKESFEMCDVKEINERAKQLSKELDANVLITLGEKGMALFEKNNQNNSFKELPTFAKEVYDVSGAGDTVVATITLALAAGASLAEAAQLANHAAGIVVGKAGTAAIKKEELLGIFKEESKIKGREELKEIVNEAKRKSKKIVTTNGVFDLMHYGHVSLLNEAKKLGDILIVAINTDESVRRIKGPKRPLLSEGERATIISALKAVDYVCLFGEDTPITLLEEIKPHIHVKGQDRKEEEIIEKDIVEQNGGKVMLLPLIEGISTTNIIGKVLERYKDEGSNKNEKK